MSNKIVKGNIMRKIFLSLVAIFAFAVGSSAQCGDELMKQALSAMGSYQYIKDFDIKVTGGATAKFSVVLNSRTHYQVNIANGASNPENVTIRLVDAEGRLLGINTASGKVFDIFQFICKKTGAYKFEVTCSGDACARAVLSLIKQYSESEMK